MNELLSLPALAASSALAFVFGMALSSVLRRSPRQAELEDAFDRGFAEGRADMRDEMERDQDRLAQSLANEFSEMKQGIVHTVRAYQRAVEVCAERLNLQGKAQLALNAPAEEEPGPDEAPQPNETLQARESEAAASGESGASEESVGDDSLSANSLRAALERLREERRAEGETAAEPEGIEEEDSPRPALSQNGDQKLEEKVLEH